eukprot:TRINITY_DN11440_c0_g1_i1.p1 TRINITY_DN11440_c0_g1~~TRINITY_DN11440_c0_g1_i1.p1  ORF type:complete len:454 (-),score=106.95 TRINITY_DN11440_c0_g1_i1:34-1395(-)
MSIIEPIKVMLLDDLDRLSDISTFRTGRSRKIRLSTKSLFVDGSPVALDVFTSDCVVRPTAAEHTNVVVIPYNAGTGITYATQEAAKRRVARALPDTAVLFCGLHLDAPHATKDHNSSMFSAWYKQLQGRTATHTASRSALFEEIARMGLKSKRRQLDVLAPSRHVMYNLSATAQTDEDTSGTPSEQEAQPCADDSRSTVAPVAVVDISPQLLPVEMVHCIMSHCDDTWTVCQSALVCREWREAAEERFENLLANQAPASRGGFQRAFLRWKYARNDMGSAIKFNNAGYVFETLETSPATLQQKDRNGLTWLHIAAQYNRLAIIRKLIALGLDVNCTSQDTLYTPLHEACLFGFTEVAEALLAAGASVHSKNDSGMTALHLAAASGVLPLVELLLKHGAKARALSSSGRTAGDLARQKCHMEIAKLLPHAGPVRPPIDVFEYDYGPERGCKCM